MKPENPRFTGKKHTAESNKKRSETLKRLYAEGSASFGFQTVYANEKERLDAIAVNRRYSKYGIRENMYRHMIDIQENTCAICDKPCSVVDHDHDSGEVRAMLCFQCNKGLGDFMDNPELLLRAAAYLMADDRLSVKSIKYGANRDGTVYAEA